MTTTATPNPGKTGVKHRLGLIADGVWNEAKRVYEHTTEYWKLGSLKRKALITAAAGAGIGTIGYLGSKFGFQWLAAQAVSTLGFMTSLAVIRGVGDTKAKVLAGAGVGALYAIPAYLLGGWGYAIMSASSSLRNACFGIIPDQTLDQNDNRLRKQLVVGLFGLTTLATIPVALKTSPIHFITLVSSFFGSAANYYSSEGNKNNRAILSRSPHIAGNTFNAIYQLCFGGLAQATVDLYTAWNARNNAVRRYDVPVIDLKNQILPEKGPNNRERLIWRMIGHALRKRPPEDLTIQVKTPTPGWAEVLRTEKQGWGTTREQLIHKDSSAMLAWAHPAVPEKTATQVFDVWRKAHLDLCTLDQLKDRFLQADEQGRTHFTSHADAGEYLSSEYFRKMRKFWQEPTTQAAPAT